MEKSRRSVITLCVLLVCMVVIGTLALTGARFGWGGRYRLKPWGEAISLGLDLRGGVYTVYRGIDNGEESFDTLMNDTIRVLTNRLDAQGYTEATIVRQGTDRIRIEVPNLQDPLDILDVIGTPAVLQFIDEDGNIVMEGKHVKTASPRLIDNSRPVVLFELTDEGRTLFAEATAANLGRKISIKIDKRTISEPVVNTVINDGTAYIEGMSSVQEAQQIAMLIQTGALPLEVEQLEMSSISATLGAEALDRFVLAGAIALILIWLFMFWRYKFCGLVADIALGLYLIILFFILAIIDIQVTLPGVLGILLGIGMAVDANIIIFERIYEEAHKGRPLHAASRAGFTSAMSTILDSNIITLIAAFVLMIFGTGILKGFANTLAISVAVSMFSAVVITRFLFRIFINIINKPDLYVRKGV